jgi:hypothetical protein
MRCPYWKVLGCIEPKNAARGKSKARGNPGKREELGKHHA